MVKLFKHELALEAEASYSRDTCSCNQRRRSRNQYNMFRNRIWRLPGVPVTQTEPLDHKQVVINLTGVIGQPPCKFHGVLESIHTEGASGCAPFSNASYLAALDNSEISSSPTNTSSNPGSFNFMHVPQRSLKINIAFVLLLASQHTSRIHRGSWRHLFNLRPCLLSRAA